MPCSSAACTTSASRTEPPGWMIAVTPARPASSIPSRKGKNASGYPLDFPLRSGEGGEASGLACRLLRAPGFGTTHRQHPQILLGGENRQRLRPIVRGNYRFDEQLGQFDSSVAVNRSVESNN